MLKQKDMKRSDWNRILKREYHYSECCYRGMKGIVSILSLQLVSQPLIIHYEHRDVTIANQGDTWLQIAFKDAFYWVTAMFDERNELQQIYFDITNGNRFETPANPTFEDLYLDIVLEADGTLHVFDRDELDDAFHSGDITKDQYQKAIGECDALYQMLVSHWQEFAAFCRAEMLRLKGENGSVKI